MLLRLRLSRILTCISVGSSCLLLLRLSFRCFTCIVDLSTDWSVRRPAKSLARPEEIQYEHNIEGLKET